MRSPTALGLPDIDPRILLALIAMAFVLLAGRVTPSACHAVGVARAGSAVAGVRRGQHRLRDDQAERAVLQRAGQPSRDSEWARSPRARLGECGPVIAPNEPVVESEPVEHLVDLVAAVFLEQNGAASVHLSGR